VSHRSRRHKKQTLDVDATAYNKTTESPTIQPATAIKITSPPSESAFPGLPQAKPQADVALESPTPTGYTAGYVEGIVQSHISVLKKQVDPRIQQAIADSATEHDARSSQQQHAQELWNQRMEKAVVTSVERIYALETRVKDLEMGLDASEDLTKEHTERIDGLEQRVNILEREEVVSKEDLESVLDEVRKDRDHLEGVFVDEFEEGANQVERVSNNLALLEGRIVALESQAQGTALPGRQRLGYQRGGDLRR
jgi:hypothetical protein